MIKKIKVLIFLLSTFTFNSYCDLSRSLDKRQITPNLFNQINFQLMSFREVIDSLISSLGLTDLEKAKVKEFCIKEMVMSAVRDSISFNNADNWFKYVTEAALQDNKAKNKKSLMKEKANLDSQLMKEKYAASREWMSDFFGHTKSVTSIFGDGIKHLLSNPKQAAVAAAIPIAIIAGYFLAKRTTKVTADYIDRALRKPELARETSKQPLLAKLSSMLMFWRKKHESNILDEVILPSDIHKQIEVLAKSLKVAVRNRQNLTNLLLYGPPGTGKTLFSTKLAKETGMHYVIVSGSDFHQFETGEGITELRNLIKWSKTQDKPTIIFIDEADAFLADRNKSSEKSRKLLNAFLAETGTETEKFMIICATNKPDLLDKAIIDRLDEKIKFDLPLLPERRSLIKLYSEKHLQNASIDTSILNDELTEKIAKITEGFSGREISKLLLAIRNRVHADGMKTLTKEHIEEIAEIRVEQHKSALNYITQV